MLGVQTHEPRPMSAVDDYVIVNRHELDKLLGKLEMYKGFDTEYSKTITELMDELAIARMLIRELGDRLATLEKKT
jgi:hypothetical protein